MWLLGSLTTVSGLALTAWGAGSSVTHEHALGTWAMCRGSAMLATGSSLFQVHLAVAAGRGQEVLAINPVSALVVTCTLLAALLIARFSEDRGTLAPTLAAPGPVPGPDLVTRPATSAHHRDRRRSSKGRRTART